MLETDFSHLHPDNATAQTITVTNTQKPHEPQKTEIIIVGGIRLPKKNVIISSLKKKGGPTANVQKFRLSDKPRLIESKNTEQNNRAIRTLTFLFLCRLPKMKSACFSLFLPPLLLTIITKDLVSLSRSSQKKKPSRSARKTRVSHPRVKPYSPTN